MSPSLITATPQTILTQNLWIINIDLKGWFVYRLTFQASKFIKVLICDDFHDEQNM